MARKPEKSRERFIGIPYRIASSVQFTALDAYEVKFIFDLLTQFNGHNNGALSPTHSILKSRGWAKGTLYRTFVSCENKGWVVVTRRGWKQRGKPTLLAITWLPIHDCHIEYDEGIEFESSSTPLNYWCIDHRTWKHKPTQGGRSHLHLVA